MHWQSLTRRVCHFDRHCNTPQAGVVDKVPHALQRSTCQSSPSTVDGLRGHPVSAVQRLRLAHDCAARDLRVYRSHRAVRPNTSLARRPLVTRGCPVTRPARVTALLLRVPLQPASCGGQVATGFAAQTGLCALFCPSWNPLPLIRPHRALHGPWLTPYHPR